MVNMGSPIIIAMMLYGFVSLSQCAIPDSISDGECLSPGPHHMKMSIEFAKKFLAGKIYSPLGSKSYFYYIHQLIENKPPNESQIAEFKDKQCPSGRWDSEPRRIYANGKQVGLNCTSDEDWSDVQCESTTNDAHFGQVIVTWTNYKDVAVVIVCVAEGQKGWAVYSKHRKLTKHTTASVLAHIAAYGFKAENAQEICYAKCPK